MEKVNTKLPNNHFSTHKPHHKDSNYKTNYNWDFVNLKNTMIS